MSANARPTSPHLQIYRWQIQMVASILHRATGVALAAGTILLLTALLALASGQPAYTAVHAFCASWIGTLLLLGWTWALAFHFVNGIRHLLQDLGWGLLPAQFVRSSWIVSISSLALTVLVWACVLAQRGGV
ncbi:MAG: succinate dehydrogenase, cytochrome b556 subunit [Rhodanobacter sp.]|nr:succinate dehydrogenase, cytochrome b556 subunit [Rhodanobacter sp.]